jgi:hypothetical protein
MKLLAWDVIFSSTVNPMVSLTRSLISRVAVIRKKKKRLWLCVHPICFREVEMHRESI